MTEDQEIEREDAEERERLMVSCAKLLCRLRMNETAPRSIQLVERGVIPPLIVRAPTSSMMRSAALLCVQANNVEELGR